MDNNKWRVFIAGTLIACVALLLSLIVSRKAQNLHVRDARTPWAQALRNALSGVFGLDSLSDKINPDIVGGLLPRPAAGLGSKGPSLGEGSIPGAGAGSAATQRAAGPECLPDAKNCAAGDNASGRPGGLEAIFRQGQGAGPSPGSFSGGASPIAGSASSLDSGPGLGRASVPQGAQPKAEDVAQILSNFIQRLHQEAAAQARSKRGNASSHARSAEATYNRPGGGLSSDISDADDSPLMASPSFRNLRNVGRDTRFGVHLFQEGMSDGARDKAGKEFDGNAKTLAPIPIIKSKGAFNQETIRARTKDEE